MTGTGPDGSSASPHTKLRIDAIKKQSSLQHISGTDKLENYLRECISLVSMAAALNGGDLDRAIAWFCNMPLVELGEQTAECLVANGKASIVRRYMTNLSAGMTG
ncbi:hypothetical protein [Pseudoxanthomonas mexicana]